MFSVGLSALVVASGARAHPHVFIDDAMTVIFGDRDIAGLRMSWTFDEMYSSMIRTDYVRGKTMTPAEVKKIEKENFLNLENYGFFLDLTINGAPVKVKAVTDFDAKFQPTQKEPVESKVADIGLGSSAVVQYTKEGEKSIATNIEYVPAKGE